MTFDDVLSDIRKLVGLPLQSVRPGAGITIIDMDDVRCCLLVRTIQGPVKSRPYGELEAIWSELMKTPAVHVEGVLQGSGTSRNQPETILANLPYVEWLKIANKKHIAYVGRKTHAYGTLKQMDAIHVAETTSRMKSESMQNGYSAIVVTSDLNTSITAMREFGGGTVRLIEQGAYSLDMISHQILFVLQTKTSLKEGSYIVLDQCDLVASNTYSICGCEYAAIDQNGVKALRIIE